MRHSSDIQMKVQNILNETFKFIFTMKIHNIHNETFK